MGRSSCRPCPSPLLGEGCPKGKGYWCFWARKRPTAAILRAPCGPWRRAKPVTQRPSRGAFYKSRCSQKQLLAKAAQRAGWSSGSLLAFLSSCSDFLTLCSNKDPQAGAVSSAFTVSAAQWVGSRFRQPGGQRLRPWACPGLPAPDPSPKRQACRVCWGVPHTRSCVWQVWGQPLPQAQGS